ncbi:MAG: immunoglobulin domain-containing protein [Burkholderiales bacterium]|nr:immunoglobulin domain-containing protein [Opitutaceae bacterium]
MNQNSRLRLLATLGLAFVFSLSLQADAVSDARTALAEGDFAAMKTGLDARLLDAPDDAPAAVLRAIARLGFAAENDLPSFLRNKLGAKVATIDFAANEFDVIFPKTLVYGTAKPFAVSGASYVHTPAYDAESNPGANLVPPIVSFENRGTTPYTLTLRFNRNTSDRPDCFSFLELDKELLGFVIAGEFLVPPFFTERAYDFGLGADSGDIVIDPEAYTATVVIPVGSVLTVGISYSPGAFRVTPTSAPPTTITVLNGKGLHSATEKFAATANFNDFLKFAADLDATAIAGVVNDLSVAGPSFSLVLSPEETGHPQDIVIAYPDIQVLLAEIKFLQGMRLLGNSYNLGLKLTPTLFDTEPLQIFIKNPALFVAKGSTPALANERGAARDRFTEAVAHYFLASDAGLWSRAEPEIGAYLFGIDPESDEDDQFRTDLSVSLSAFRDALTAPVLLAELSDDLAEDETLPDDAAISLAPFFGPKPFNVRGVLPVVTYKVSKTNPPVVSSGIVPGTSTKLLTSGLLPNVSTEWWERFLDHADVVSPDAPAVVTKPLIQTQPVKLLTVPEGAPATLSVVAEFFPVTGKTYRWHKNKLPIPLPVNPGDPDPTRRTFTIPATVRGDAGDYTVVVTNIIKPGVINKVTSSVAKLVITYGPEITASPAPRTVLAGRPTKFTAAAVGVPAPTYQWYKGDTLIKNAKAASYSITAVTAASAGDYSVRATSGAVTQGTTPVALIVHEKPRFTLKPIARTVVAGADVSFTVTVAGNPAPTLQWFKNNLPLEGQTGTSLVLNDVIAGLDGPAGTYHAVATNTTVNAAGTGTQTNAVPSVKVKLVVKP